MSEATVDEIMARPYARVLVAQEGGGYTAEVLEFPGCIAEGDTAEATHAALDRVARAWVEGALEQGQGIPPPITDYDAGRDVAAALDELAERRAEVAALTAERDALRKVAEAATVVDPHATRGWADLRAALAEWRAAPQLPGAPGIAGGIEMSERFTDEQDTERDAAVDAECEHEMALAYIATLEADIAALRAEVAALVAERDALRKVAEAARYVRACDSREVYEAAGELDDALAALDRHDGLAALPKQEEQ